MWQQDHRALFLSCLEGLENDPTVKEMQAIPQHVKGVSCYDHCLFVSYLSFTMCRILGFDYRAAARAGLLHDLYLQHWEDTDVGLFERLYIHPEMALKNAAERFDLSEKEADIILKHMWPLTVVPPRYMESLVVSLVDTFCSASDYLRVKKHDKTAKAAAVCVSSESGDKRV